MEGICIADLSADIYYNKIVIVQKIHNEVCSMKKIISLITLVCMTFVFVPAGVLAANSVVSSYDLANTTLVVNADFGENAADLVTNILVFKAGTTVNDSSLPPLFKSAFTDDNGQLELSFSIPASFVSDKYTVRVSNEKGTCDSSFLYAKSSDIKAVMLLLNGASSATDVENIIKDNYAGLALDETLVSPYVAELSNAYYEICSDTDYTDEKVFYPDFMQCLAMAEITLGNDVASVLNNYKLYIGSEADDIKNYPHSVQSLLNAYVSDAKYENGLLSEQLPLLRVLAFFKSSATWGQAKLNILGTDSTGTVYIDNFAVLSPDLTYYNKVTNINLVYETIYSQRGTVTTFSSLKSVFENAAKSVYDSEQNPGYDGGSMGGSASIPSASVAPGTNPVDIVNNSRFSDVTGHWAKDYIEELADTNVISGYPDGTFAPDKNVTRAEFSKMIMAYSGLACGASSLDFADVKHDDWFYVYVSGAFEHGFINGISKTEFAPDTAITRQDVCTIIYRYLGERLSFSKIASFADSDLVADYALDAVLALYENDILTGYEDGSFKPQNLITRAETAVILSRVTDYLN